MEVGFSLFVHNFQSQSDGVPACIMAGPTLDIYGERLWARLDFSSAWHTVGIETGRIHVSYDLTQ